MWANSADSHFLEPENLWTERLAPALAAEMPRSVKDDDGRHETVHVDGQTIRRRLPSNANAEFRAASYRPPGSRDVAARLKDLDAEGIWAELVFPSLGMWNSAFRTPSLLDAVLRVSNDWVHETIIKVTPRMVPTAQVSVLSVDDAVRELQRTAALGFRAMFLPAAPPSSQPDYPDPYWEPLWAAAAEIGTVLAVHIGTEPLDLTGTQGIFYRGPGGAIFNHVESTYSGQRAAVKLVAGGILDRYPSLRVVIAEGGATWVPFIGDRMLEAYRQHSSHVRPKLSRSPKEILYEQVYASFQHDETAVAAATSMGYNNVMWGSDYPHLEGTFGHTQEVLRGLFGPSVPAAVRHRITVGAFLELFPDVGQPSAPG